MGQAETCLRRGKGVWYYTFCTFSFPKWSKDHILKTSRTDKGVRYSAKTQHVIYKNQ